MIPFTTFKPPNCDSSMGGNQSSWCPRSPGSDLEVPSALARLVVSPMARQLGSQTMVGMIDDEPQTAIYTLQKKMDCQIFHQEGVIWYWRTFYHRAKGKSHLSGETMDVDAATTKLEALQNTALQYVSCWILHTLCAEMRNHSSNMPWSLNWHLASQLWSR